MPDDREQTDVRLTITEVAPKVGQYGRWTEIEVWHWHHDDAHPTRFALSVDGHPDLEIGDLVRRFSDTGCSDTGWLAWWDNAGERMPGRLRIVSEVVQLPVMD